MPISAVLFYGGAHPPPTNASATPHMYNVTVADTLVYLPTPSSGHQRGTARVVTSAGNQSADGATGALHDASDDVSFEFVGLPESLMTGFHFDNITIVGEANKGWTCSYTQGFTFTHVSPMPSTASGCL